MKKVLFVDDEQPVLDALKRMLKPQRELWDMYFRTSGDDAVELMDRVDIDVLVSDIQMPGMTGDALLRYVHDHYPSVIRIMLSGINEGELDMRKIPIAHHYIEKPCSAPTLMNVVERAYALYDRLRHPRLAAFFDGPLQSLDAPRIYVVLTKALTNPKTTAEDLVKILEEDEHLAGQLLVFARSTIIGAKTRPENLREATVAMGMSMMKNAALSFAVLRMQEHSTGDMTGIHQHVMSVADIAKKISPVEHSENDLVLAAMLHDVGKWVIATTDPERYQRTISLAAEKGCSFFEAEAAACEVSHAEIGAALLERWGLTYPVVEAVANHHTLMPTLRETISMPMVLYVADRLAHRRSFGDDEQRQLGIEAVLSTWQGLVE